MPLAIQSSLPLVVPAFVPKRQFFLVRCSLPFNLQEESFVNHNKRIKCLPSSGIIVCGSSTAALFWRRETQPRTYVNRSRRIGFLRPRKISSSCPGSKNDFMIGNEQTTQRFQELMMTLNKFH
jgi:hypothetical protein